METTYISQKIKERQLQILEDTAKAFNSSTRCTAKDNGEGACRYHAEGKEGCAVGRLIDDVELKKDLDQQPNSGVIKIFDRLPHDLKELGKDFLNVLQRLHDNPNNWDKNGLSDEGMDMINCIKKEFDL